MKIYRAKLSDLDKIMEIYSSARKYMSENGNGSQWSKGYPWEYLIVKSIEDGKQYICSYNNKIVGTFYFAIEPEPNYRTIKDGKWLNNEPYGVIHRIASGGSVKGVGEFSIKWCVDNCRNLRIDTHKNNAPMQHLLRKMGFSYCGIINVFDGTERTAFQKCIL